MHKFLTGAVSLVLLLLAGAAQASFHFMQIHQAIGGVDNDTALQAIQLRMRFGGQTIVGMRILNVVDAAGLNPVQIIQFPNNVSTGTAGSTILIATTEFQAATGITADFTMTNPIPASYLPAGRLTFESGGSVYWAVAWGGTGYTGSNSGLGTNDDNNPGDFGPPFDGPLPSDSTSALLFGGAAGDLSTNNAADYAVTAGAATFTNNAGESALVVLPDMVFSDGFEQAAP